VSTIDNYTVEQWLTQYGFSYNSNDPFADVYQVVALRNMPSSVPNPPGQQNTANLIEACLRARAFLDKDGNGKVCGLPGGTSGQTQITPSPVSTGLQLGVAGATSTVSILGAAAPGLLSVGVSAGLGVATAGIGLILGPLISLINAKAERQEQEDNVLCNVSTAFNSSLPNLDSYVRSGGISVTDAVGSLTTVLQQLIQQIEGLEQKNCNAACVYETVLKAHLDFAANIYYPAISGQSQVPNAPASAPAVASAGSLAAVTPSPVAAVVVEPGTAVGSGLSPTVILFLVAVVVVIAVVSGRVTLTK